MVLVCSDPPFVYLKTHKTASTSVEMALQRALEDDPAAEITERTPARLTARGVIGSRLYRRRLDYLTNYRVQKWRPHVAADRVRAWIGEADWARSAKIAMIRNPFDRLVSYFHFKARYRRLAHDWDAQRAAFQDFAASNKWRDDREIVFSRGEFCITHPILFERLREDLARVANSLSIAPVGDLPHTKPRSAPRRDTADYFDPPAIEIVRRRMAWVFEHFDYPERPGAAQLETA